jgi:hypothetical protein
MATHEVIAGLGASFDLVDPGVPVAASLGASFDQTFAPIQNLDLTAALGFSAELVAQRGDQNLSVVALHGGSLTVQEGRKVHVQPYRVKGLANGLADEQRLLEAVAAPGIPMDGTAHPFEPGIQVIDTRASFQVAGDQRVDNTRVNVEITWGRPLADALTKGGGVSGGGVFSIAPSTFTETVWRDKDGAFMDLRYFGSGALFARRVSADLQRKTWTATLTKEFNTPQYSDIQRASQVNTELFGVFGAHTLLFLGATLNETDEGKFSHGYQFTFNPDGWTLRSSIWIGGAIPDDATENFNPLGGEPGGLGIFFIYEEFNFADLPVFFP